MSPLIFQKARVRSLLDRMQIDAHILATLMFRFWSVIAGGVTVLLTPVFLSPVEQGYYYTFGSILMLQVFFELGIGQVIVQIVAHEAAHLKPNLDGCYSGNINAEARLSSLRSLLRNWYRVISILFVFSVILLGLSFFYNSELPASRWAPPWIILVTATGINLALGWRVAMIEGFGLVKEVNSLRLRQSMTGFGLMWCALVAGGGLWVVAIVPITGAIFTMIWLRKPMALRITASPLQDSPSVIALSWYHDIFPFQWRIAVSWISGFFIFQLFAPIIFKYHGAIEAGRIGLAITLFNSLVSVSTAWVGAKVPTLGAMITLGKHDEASLLYRRLAIASMGFIIITTISLLLVIELCRMLDLNIIYRLPTIESMLFLAAAAIGNAFINSAALFMRSHKEEPLLKSSIGMAVAVTVAIIFSAPLGSTWVVGSYSILVCTLGLPWTILILKRYYRPGGTVRNVD